MLTVSPIRNIKYYSDLAKDDYYLDGGEPNGIWAGQASKLIDLTGDVETECYINVMRGFTPNKKYKLCQNPGNDRRYGWDLTFSSPKSVSIAWARANKGLKQKIQQAHFQSVKAAIAFIEEHAALTRREKVGHIREKVTGLVCATFEHATSRAQDPQLHTHCLVANAAPREDGTWGTIESRDLYLWHKAGGTLYRAELASQLKELGFEIEKEGDAFKLPIVPNEICTYYSKRGEVIKAELAKRGNSNSCSKSGDIAALATRAKKENVKRSVLYQQWHQELDELGFTENSILKELSQVKATKLSWLNEIENPKLELTLDTLEEHVSKQKSVFRMQDIYKTAAEIAQISGGGAEKAQEVAQEFIEHKFCISLGLDAKHNALFTTQSVIDNEKAMIKGAKNLRNQHDFYIDNALIANAILSKEFPLTDEQKEAVLSACQANAFDIIQGSAGAGKSALMDCVAKAYQNSGYKVFGCAIAKSAANNLAEEANIETFTIAKLLKDKSLADNSILIVDEAGQVGTKDLRKLIELVDNKKGKLILVGEDKQLDAIEHGGALKYLSQPEVLGTTRVETIKRQRESWAREVVANFRDGKAKEALETLDDKGLLYFSADSDLTKSLLIEKWNQFKTESPDKKSLLLAQRWQDVTQLNDRVRNILKSEGKIEKQEISVKCSVSGKTFINKFSKGERIRLTKNDYSKGLSNGDLGNIVDIQSKTDGSHDLKVKLDNGNKVIINTGEYCNDDGHLYMSQAYAMTVYSSQGLTIDGDVFIYYTTGMDRANTYVACSRQKDNSHVFVNKRELSIERFNIDKEQLTSNLADNMSRDKQSKLAIEYLNEVEHTKNMELAL